MGSESSFVRNSVLYIISSVLLTFSNQERPFFADILFSLKSKIAATKACLKNEREEKSEIHCSVGNCRSSYKTPIQFFYRGFSNASFLYEGNYDCEPLLGIYPDSQLGSSLHLALGHVLKFIQ